VNTCTCTLSTNTGMSTRMDTNTNDWRTQAEIVRQNESRKYRRNSARRISQRIRVVTTVNILNARVQDSVTDYLAVYCPVGKKDRHTHEPRLYQFVVSLESQDGTKITDFNSFCHFTTLYLPLRLCAVECDCTLMTNVRSGKICEKESVTYFKL
jgi:hypothetical protein